MRSILEESSSECVRRCLQKVPYESWSNIDMVEYLSKHFYFNAEDTTKSKLKEELSSFWELNKTSTKNSKSVNKRLKQLHRCVDQAISSRPVSAIIKMNLSAQEKINLKESIKYHAIVEVNTELESITLSQETDKDAEPDRVILVQENESDVVQKKRKYFDAKKVIELSLIEKINAVIESYSVDKEVLDLRKPGMIPLRCSAIIDSILKEASLQLIVKLTDKEYKVIKKISKCKDNAALMNEVDTINLLSSDPELPFIKLAITKLCLLYHGESLVLDHNEDWFRVNVYGDLFDSLFNGKNGYKTKRSECYSQTIKSLKEKGLLSADEKDLRLDFIFTNSTGIQDLFFCEDKASHKISKKDKVKSDDLREKTLKHWSTLLPYPECVKYLCVLSCHFNQLNLRIMGSKLIDNVLIHACLKEISIPESDNNGAGVAEYLTAVISLYRMVLWNFETINYITSIKQEDDIEFLTKPTSSSTIFYREDSPTSDYTNSSSSSYHNWELEERKARILEKIECRFSERIAEDTEMYKSSIWESIVFEEDL